MKRLTAAQVRTVRISMAAQQGNRCGLCKGQFGTRAPLDPVLDHDHRTGAVRGVLHRCCNSLLGKIENNAPRYGVRDIPAFVNGVAAYLIQHITNTTGYLHPSHRTEEEKRILRNMRARKARANKKETA